MTSRLRNERLREISLKNKEKDKMKEREKEAKERETRVANGHLFNCITVSGNTLCYVCNKSIITREAFICTTCSVTIHKTCKDALPSCIKVKQKQLKAAQARNSSALHNVAFRTKVPGSRERPSSAVFASDSGRQTPLFPQLGSRRGRTPFHSLSKSVSTNNIGNLNDDTPFRRILSQSTDSLNMRNRTLSVESLIDEGASSVYTQLMGDLETDEKDFAADSWSLAVDSSFLQTQRKDVIKRQDVIYELIQTEVHHVRTLKIMSEIFRKGMLEDLQMDPLTVQTLFPSLDELVSLHVHFLSELLTRRKHSLQPGSTNNFVIQRLGDLLVNQFSGTSGEEMRRAYTEFCSRHTKAVKLYKELFTRDKRFQQFVRRMTRSSVLRRHGVQECILLVTQRITKYPVILTRLLHITKANDQDQEDLARALTLVKELITRVDQDVHDSEKRSRLQEICSRFDSRSLTIMHSGREFRREDLLCRKLVHDGFVLWKNATGRFKDIQVLLLTDVLVFLQEKDQRYSFPGLDSKPAVLSLQKLIARDIANQEKGMFLISAAAPTPEMYEIHTGSREDRNTWIRLIEQCSRVCPKMEDFSKEMETKAMLSELKDEMEQRDRGIAALLEEKTSLFLQLVQLRGCEGPTAPLGGKMFRSETSETPKGERLLSNAIKEVGSLVSLVTPVIPETEPNRNKTQTSTNQQPCPQGNNNSNGGETKVNGTAELYPINSVDAKQDGNGNQLQCKSHSEELLQGLGRLSIILHSLQAVVVRQDSLLELANGPLSRASSLGEQERVWGEEKQREELLGLRRQHSLLQGELQRAWKLGQDRAQEISALEVRLLEVEKSQDRPGEVIPSPNPSPSPSPAPQSLRKRSHCRHFSLPSAQFLPGVTPQKTLEQRRRSVDETSLCLSGFTASLSLPFSHLLGASEEMGAGEESCPQEALEAGLVAGSLEVPEERGNEPQEESGPPSPISSDSSEETSPDPQADKISEVAQYIPECGGEARELAEEDEDEYY